MVGTEHDAFSYPPRSPTVKPGYGALSRGLEVTCVAEREGQVDRNGPQRVPRQVN